MTPVPPRTHFPGFRYGRDPAVAALDWLPSSSLDYHAGVGGTAAGHDAAGGARRIPPPPPSSLLLHALFSRPSSVLALQQQSLDLQNRLYLERRLRALRQSSLISQVMRQHHAQEQEQYARSLLPHHRGEVPEGVSPDAATDPVLSCSSSEFPRTRPGATTTSSSTARSSQPEVNVSSYSAHGQTSASKPTLERAWDIMFKRLVQHRMLHGNCLVREKDDPKLGRWVRNQRNRKKQGRLSPERVNQLGSLGFVWSMVNQESWDVMYQRLVDYKAKHGDCLVPRSHKADPKLGRWVDTQRNKNRNDMTDDRLKQLADIGFVWHVHKQSWEAMFERLKQFKKEKGSCVVPSVYKEDPKLGTWVHVQRSRRSILSDERKKKLDSIGFVWCMFDLKRKSSEPSPYC